MSDESKVTILDLFERKGLLPQFKESLTSNGEICYKGPCPCCGFSSGGSNSSGMVIFPNTNYCYCSSSKTKFDFTKTMELILGEITCREGDK